MKKAILIALAALSLAAIGKPFSTHWTGKSEPHRHGVGMVCPHCGQTWGAIPKGLKAWEVRHLKREMLKFYNLYLKVRHGIVRR